MRVTFHSMDAGLEAINRAAAQFQRAQAQVATGRRIVVASDDPGGIERVIRGKAEIGAIDAYTRTADSATARLSVMDTVLSDIIEKLTSATATTAGARGSAVPQSARDAAAAALGGIREAIAADINTRFGSTALFGGSEGDVTPYAWIGGVWTYQGNMDEVALDIGRNRIVTVSIPGVTLAQGGDAEDIFTVLDNLAAAVQAGDQAGMADGMAALERAFDRATRAQGRVGMDLRSIEDEQASLSAFRLASRTRVSADEDTNVAAALTEMSQADTAYRAALGAVGAASRVSLIDYLR